MDKNDYYRYMYAEGSGKRSKVMKESLEKPGNLEIDFEWQSWSSLFT